MEKLKHLFDKLDALDWQNLGNNTETMLHEIDALIQEIGFDGYAMKNSFLEYYLNPMHFKRMPNPTKPTKPE